MDAEIMLSGLTDGQTSALEVQPLIVEEIKSSKKDDAKLQMSHRGNHLAL